MIIQVESMQIVFTAICNRYTVFVSMIRKLFIVCSFT